MWLKFQKYKVSLVSVALYLFAYNAVLGQIGHSGFPVGLNNNKSQISFIEFSSAEKLYNQFIEKTQKDKSLLKNDVFASAVEVSISPKGQGAWHIGDNNSRIWQIGITANNASSLNLIFKNFHLLPGCRLFIYSPKMEEIYGAFTFRNNKKSKIFAISPVQNDSLIIELQLDNGVSDFGTLELAQVGVGFPGEYLYKSAEDEYYNGSAQCHVDINCNISEHVQRQKYSVCRIIYGAAYRCTGTLINNTEEDGRPLILTAGHCIMNESDAESALYFFNYESPYCSGSDGEMFSISGSTLLSRRQGLDYSLVEMSENPPADYFPLYAGWDAEESNFDSVYIIHHPEGDVKKITTNSDMLLKGTFIPFDDETHWLITKYDTGTTEAGSSGAALFNSDSRIIGTLTGGGNECTEYIYDYYQMFSHCWADYSNEDEQLKAWLDPSNSGKTFIDNYAPIDPLYAVSEELSNSMSGEKDTLIEAAEGWGYISGHNHLQIKEYAEYFSINGTKYIYALNIKVARRHITQSNSKIKIKVWKDNDYPHDLIYEKDLYYFELINNQENFIRLDTILYVNNGFYIGYEINYDHPEDTFAVYTSMPATEIAVNTAFYRSADQWLPLITDRYQSTPASLSIKVLAMNYYPPDKQNPEDFPVKEVTLYPNPTYGNLQVLFKSEPPEEIDLKVYDLSGRLVLNVTKQSTGPNFVLNTNNLNQGLYLLKITYSGVGYTLKFVKL